MVVYWRLLTLSHGHVLALGFKTTFFHHFHMKHGDAGLILGLILALLIPPITGLAGHQCPFQHLRPGTIATEGYRVPLDSASKNHRLIIKQDMCSQQEMGDKIRSILPQKMALDSKHCPQIKLLSR